MSVKFVSDTQLQPNTVDMLPLKVRTRYINNFLRDRNADKWN